MTEFPTMPPRKPKQLSPSKRIATSSDQGGIFKKQKTDLGGRQLTLDSFFGIAREGSKPVSVASSNGGTPVKGTTAPSSSKTIVSQQEKSPSTPMVVEQHVVTNDASANHKAIHDLDPGRQLNKQAKDRDFEQEQEQAWKNLGLNHSGDFEPFDASKLSQFYVEYDEDAKCHSCSYEYFARILEQVCSTKSRLAIRCTLGNFFRVLLLTDRQAICPSLYIMSNRIAPPHVNLELGIGHRAISSIIKSTCNVNEKWYREAWIKYGDIGDVAAKARAQASSFFTKQQAKKPLTIVDVFKTMTKIAQSQGPGSASTKVELASSLVRRARASPRNSESSVRFLIRSLSANMRIGASRLSVLAAFAWALAFHEWDSRQALPAIDTEAIKSKAVEYESILKTAYAQCPDFDRILHFIFEDHVALHDLLQVCGCVAGTPILPMLGKITSSLDKVLSTLQNRAFVADWKLDGIRLQIHVSETNKVSIFSRHLENTTERFPDVVASFQQRHMAKKNISSLIIDAEVVAVDATGAMLSFQELSRRPRKPRADIPPSPLVCVVAFDLMYLDGKSLLTHSLRERRALMYEYFEEKHKNEFAIITHLVCESTAGNEQETRQEKLSSFFQESLDNKNEGLMIKVLDHDLELQVNRAGNSSRGQILATYEPDKRLESWMKVKKDYLDGVVDTLDLVPIGAWNGNGRKSQWYSPFLLACWNPDKECFESVCKVMSGFSDEFYKANREKYDPSSDLVLSKGRDDYEVDSVLEPRYWFDANEVWEIKGAEFSISANHTCGRGELETAGLGIVTETSGLSLRFPRFMRVREDKDPREPESVTTTQQIIEMWKLSLEKKEKIEKEMEKEEEDSD